MVHLILFKPSSLITDQVSKKACALSVLVLIFTFSFRTRCCGVFPFCHPFDNIIYAVHLVCELLCVSHHKDRVCVSSTSTRVVDGLQIPMLVSQNPQQVTAHRRHRRTYGCTMSLDLDPGQQCPNNVRSSIR